MENLSFHVWLQILFEHLNAKGFSLENRWSRLELSITCMKPFYCVGGRLGWKYLKLLKIALRAKFDPCKLTLNRLKSFHLHDESATVKHKVNGNCCKSFNMIYSAVNIQCKRFPLHSNDFCEFSFRYLNYAFGKSKISQLLMMSSYLQLKMLQRWQSSIANKEEI